MKKTATLLIVLMLPFIVAFTATTHAQNPTYLCVLENDTLISPTVFQFEVFIYRTGSIDLYLNNYQLSFKITNDATSLNGGKLSGIFVHGSCQLGSQYTPMGLNIFPGVTDKLIRINGPAASTCGVLIPDTSLKIGTFQITNTVAYSLKPEINWWKAPPASTIIRAIIPSAPCGPSEEITNIVSHVHNFPNVGTH